MTEYETRYINHTCDSRLSLRTDENIHIDLYITYLYNILEIHKDTRREYNSGGIQADQKQAGGRDGVQVGERSELVFRLPHFVFREFWDVGRVVSRVRYR